MRSAFNVEVAVVKLNRHKSPGSDQIPPELIKARSGAICSEFHNLISSVWLKRNCLSSGRIQSLYLFIRRVIKPTRYYRGISLCQIHTKFYPTSCCQG